MWGFGHGYGYFDSFDDGWGGPSRGERSGWAEKSEAASRRESIANRKLDAFLEKCASEHVPTSTAFPITEEVVGAETHLTSACWTSFRKRVESKGCKAKRREATPAERAASKDKRKGKLYVISVTCPVHPSKALAAMKEKKEKAEASAAARKQKAKAAAERKAAEERKRAEEAKKEREERERLAALHRAKVREEYEAIVGGSGGREETSKRKTRGSSNNNKAKKGEGKAAAKATTTSVGMASLLQHAEKVHEDRLAEIRTSRYAEQDELLKQLREKHRKEESELLEQLGEKQRGLEAKAAGEYDEAREKIREAGGGADAVDKENEVNT